jgi:gluconokinase
MQWFTEKVTKRKSVGNLFKQTKNIAAGADGLTFFPYVFGERAPLWDANARGMYHGVSASHGQLHFAKATIEGILFNLRFILEEIEATTEIPLQKVIAGGGFFRSKIGTQLAADILGKTIVLRESHDNSAYGAVLQAMKGLGHISDYEEKQDWWQEGSIFTPNKDLKETYNILFRKYQNLQKKFR